MLFKWTKANKFNNLLSEYIDSLLQFAYARCQDKLLAEDLVQETCIKAYKAYLSKDEEILKPREWLFKILINTHISYLRKKQVQIIEDFDFNSYEISNNSDSNVDFDEEISIELLREDLCSALGELGVEQRSAIYLIDIKGLSFKEASDLLGIPFGTLTSRLHRGRQKLKNLLKKTGNYELYAQVGAGYGL